MDINIPNQAGVIPPEYIPPAFHRYQPSGTPRLLTDIGSSPCRWYRIPLHPPKPGSHCIPASYKTSMYNKQWLRNHEDYLRASIRGQVTQRENSASNFLNFVFLKPLNYKGGTPKTNIDNHPPKVRRDNILNPPLGEQSPYSSYIDHVVVMSSDPVADISSANCPTNDSWLQCSMEREPTRGHVTNIQYVAVESGRRKLKIPGYVLPPICDI